VLDFYCSHEVLNEFPTYSSQVPNVFPISPPHFIPYPFALSFGLVTFISNPKEEIPTIFILVDSKA